MAENKEKSIIHLEEVQFSWNQGKNTILNIPEFKIDARERIFIQGPSGCGKTTLLGLLGGVLVTEYGKVEVLGKNLHQLTGKQRDAFRVEHVGFVFQMFNLLPYLSVIENIMLPCHFSRRRKEKAVQRSGSPKAEAQRLLVDLGLSDVVLHHQSVSELSVGQQQRVAVARALIGSPDIIIADEPTSSLDSDAREAFLKLLFKECEEFETTLVFVSHDSSLANFFHRTVKMSEINRSLTGNQMKNQ